MGDITEDSRNSIVGLGYCGNLYLAVFVNYFISFFVLPNNPVASINPLVFPLAVKLYSDNQIPLVPLFSGNLYFRLNFIHLDMERSMGHYDVWSFVHT